MKIMDAFGELLSEFRRNLDDWVCDPYACDIRYVGAQTPDGGWELVAAELVLVPIPVEKTIQYEVACSGFVGGQQIMNGQVLLSLADRISEAGRGELALNGRILRIPRGGVLRISVDQPEPWWINRPTIVIQGDRSPSLPTGASRRQLDQELRSAEIPFDGLTDLFRWLGLRDPSIDHGACELRVSLHPPCEIVFDRSGFRGDVFALTLNAHPALDRSRVKVALVSYPGEIPASRVQLSNLQWEVDSDKKILVGTAAIELPDAERALVLLSVSSTCVQRQWFINSTKTQNGRLLVSKAFDAELKQLSRCLLEPVSQDKFELAVSHLAFLRGFNAQVLVEKEAPDIVLETPGGQLVLVECTIQTKDVHTKVGKLVDRRHALIMALDRAKQRRTVLAALVSQQRREQIAMTDNEFKDRGVVLVTHDMLSEQLGLAGLSVDADEIVRKAVAYLEQD